MAANAARDLLWGYLSEPERRRAGRFAFERDRDRFVVAHGALRSILSLYARVPVPQLEIRSDPGGKPRLASPSELRFNLSHSGDRALLAVTWDREVGIDLEAVRTLEDLVGLATSCFSPTERRALSAVPEALRLEAFYDGWTRKEAFLKLLGDGLSRPLDSFDVTLSPGEPPSLLRVAGECADRWRLQSVEVGPGYRGALASEGPAATVHLREWAVMSQSGSSDERRGPRGREDIRRGPQPRAAVPDLAGGPGRAERLAGRRKDGNKERVPRLGQGDVDRHAPASLRLARPSQA